MADSRDCVPIVPLSDYDWGYSKRPSWLPWNPIVFSLLVAFSALAYYISLELLILVLVKFKRRNSVYFWSIVTTTVGVILQTTGYLLTKFENTCPPAFVILISQVGWVCNVTGFSLVLWSRLHLVIKDPRILKGVLIMIVMDAILCQGSVMILEFGSLSQHQQAFYSAARIAQRVQQVVFTTQESFIAILYMYYTCRFFNCGYPSGTWNVSGWLVALQVLVVAMDILLTALLFTNKNTIKCMLHPLFYAFKVRLEFIVLNLLRGACNGGMADTGLTFTATVFDAPPMDGKRRGLSLSRKRASSGAVPPPKSWSWAEETAVGGGGGGGEGFRPRQDSERTMVEDWDGHFTGGPSWKFI